MVHLRVTIRIYEMYIVYVMCLCVLMLIRLDLVQNNSQSNQ